MQMVKVTVVEPNINKVVRRSMLMEKVKIKKKETYIQSSNGCNMLHVVVWEPQCEIRGAES